MSTKSLDNKNTGQKVGKPPPKRSDSVGSLELTKKASETNYDFRIFSCGTKGGGYASQITSFFIAEKSEPFNFVSMDAGTSLDCIATAKGNGQLDKILDPAYSGQGDLNKVGYFRKKQLNGFLVTHAHADHIAGLLISSAEDIFGKKKPIIGTRDSIDGVKVAMDRPIWPNMIKLGFYNTQILNPSDKLKAIKDLDGSTGALFNGNKMHIQVYPLSHDMSNGYSPSSAFKVCNKADGGGKSCILFFGDTAPDAAEWRNLKKGLVDEANHNVPFKNPSVKVPYLKADNIDTPDKLEGELNTLMTNNRKAVIELKRLFNQRTGDDVGKNWHLLADVWKDIAKDVADGVVHTIFVECSYDKNNRGEGMWYGHFIPKTLLSELGKLAKTAFKAAGDKKPEHTLSVFVMHIKPTFGKNDDDLASYNNIKQLLSWKKSDKLDVGFFFPLQTDMIYVKREHNAVIVPAPENKGKSALARMEMEDLLRSDFGHDVDVDYGNVNGYGHGQFMHHRQPQYGPKGDGFYHHEASQQYVGGDGGGYYVAPAHPPIHYQNPLNINLLLVTTLLMFLCVCVCCASFVCGFSVRHVMRKLIKKTKRYQVNEDEVEHKYVV